MGVAQLVFAFISELAVGVAMHSDAVKNGEWSNCPDFCFWKKPLTELSGKTILTVMVAPCRVQIRSHSANLSRRFSFVKLVGISSMNQPPAGI